MVGDVEGPMTEYIGEKVPPKLGEESKPSLHISQKYNNTVELQLLSPDVNKKCEVSFPELILISRQYNVKFLLRLNPTTSSITIWEMTFLSWRPPSPSQTSPRRM